VIDTSEKRHIMVIIVLFVSGIMSIVFGITVYLMDIFFPNAATSFFGVDVLQDDDEVTGPEGRYIALSSHYGETSLKHNTSMCQNRNTNITLLTEHERWNFFLDANEKSRESKQRKSVMFYS